MNSPRFTREQYIECKWYYDDPLEEFYGYTSIMQSLQKSAKDKTDAGLEVQSNILNLLSRAASMRLTPDSLNEPFKPLFQDFQAGRRSPIPEDFTPEEIAFFESILNDIDDHWLKARLADLLWLQRGPKDPTHANLAIESYTTHAIRPETWHRDVSACWERAGRLALQINNNDKLDEIKNRLFAAFNIEYPSNEFMCLWLGDFLDRLSIDVSFRKDIALRLSIIGSKLKTDGNFHSARSYYELAAKKYRQCNDDKGWLDNLALIADCFEQEANLRVADSNMVANSFYESAIQAYRRIPNKHRDSYNVENKIISIRAKITDTGKASLDEMGIISTPGVDLSEEASSSIRHVSGKQTLQEALAFFAGIYPGPKYKELKEGALESMKHSPLLSLTGSNHMSVDGRVVAKVPPANLGAGEDDPANQAVLQRAIQQAFSIEVQLVVRGRILPALNQLLMEHKFTKDILSDLCYYSSVVPQDREHLLANALWLGFEHDFGSSIYLLCPQLEHIVRVHLKSAGALTSNIDRDGIENENGLSTLMDLQEAKSLLGDDLAFEIKSIFTEALGYNLRNEIAHGLLDDNSSASFPSIYAWWMVLRIITNSLMMGKPFSAINE